MRLWHRAAPVPPVAPSKDMTEAVEHAAGLAADAQQRAAARAGRVRRLRLAREENSLGERLRRAFEADS